MKIYVLTGAVIAVTVLAALALLQREPDRPVPVITEPTPAEAVPAVDDARAPETQRREGHEPGAPLDPNEQTMPADGKFVGTTEDGKQLTVDLTRLDELGYQNDPAIQYIADRVGIPAQCVVENFKIGYEMLDQRSPYCVANDPEVATIPDYAIQNPEYEKYSNAELEQLAAYELDAAILLARRHARAGNNAEAQKYYEEAMQMLLEQGIDPAMVRNEMKGRLP